MYYQKAEKKINPKTFFFKSFKFNFVP